MEDDLTQVGSLIKDLIRLYHFSGGSSRSTRWALCSYDSLCLFVKIDVAGVLVHQSRTCKDDIM